MATFSSVLHDRRRRTLLITSGTLVITVLKCSRKDRYDQAFADPSQAPPPAAFRGRLPSDPGHCLWSGIVPTERAARVVAWPASLIRYQV